MGELPGLPRVDQRVPTARRQAHGERLGRDRPVGQPLHGLAVVGDDAGLGVLHAVQDARPVDALLRPCRHGRVLDRLDPVGAVFAGPLEHGGVVADLLRLGLHNGHSTHFSAAAGQGHGETVRADLRQRVRQPLEQVTAGGLQVLTHPFVDGLLQHEPQQVGGQGQGVVGAHWGAPFCEARAVNRAWMRDALLLSPTCRAHVSSGTRPFGLFQFCWMAAANSCA